MSTIADLLKSECSQHLNTGHERILKCVALLSDEQLWHRPNTHVVSVGNLVLHLAGNVGQWINATLGDDPDGRERDSEFNAQGPMAREELLAGLDRTMARALDVIAHVSAERLERMHEVQVYSVTGVGILVHVTEHFSYHVGQITLHTKLLRDMDTGYYAGADLNKKH